MTIEQTLTAALAAVIDDVHPSCDKCSGDATTVVRCSSGLPILSLLCGHCVTLLRAWAFAQQLIKCACGDQGPLLSDVTVEISLTEWMTAS